MPNGLTIRWFSVLLLPLIAAPLFAQSYVKYFPVKGERNSSAKLWHIEDDHYYLFRMYPIEENEWEEKYLQIIEFDYCGIVEVRHIYFDQLWSINLTGEIFESNDSLRIPVRVNPSPNGPHTEIGLLSIDKNSLSGRYQYLRALNVIHNLSIQPYREDFYLVKGFASYTDRPVAHVLFRMDSDFKIIDYYQSEMANTASGDAEVIGNSIYNFSGRGLMKLTSNLQPVWTKAIHWHYYILKSIAVEDGILLAMTRRYGDRNLIVVKIDLDGNMLWQSKNLTLGSAYSYIANIVKKEDGQIFVFTQERNEDYTSAGILLWSIDAQDGTIVNQWKADEPYGNLIYRDFLHERDGGSLVAADAQDNIYVIKFNMEAAANCPLEERVEPSFLIPLEIRDTVNFSNVTAPFTTGSFNFTPVPSRATADNLCQDELPTFDLMPEETTLCGAQTFVVDLSSIPFKTTWENGSEDPLREINAAGQYAYTYEVCDQIYGEQLIVENDSCPCDWYLPNAFSPANGTENDEYYIQNSCKEILYFSIKIFNRWGGLMYYSNDPTFRWDGTWRGKPLQSGLYTYLLDYEDAKLPGSPQQLQGTIALLR